MTTYLVESTTPTGAHMTTRHYSAELASIEVISRLGQKHSDVGTSEAGPADVVYAQLDRNAMTRERKPKPALQVARVAR